MYKIQTYLFALLLLVAAGSCKSKDKEQGGSGPAYTLKMRLANGDKFGQDMDVNMDVNMKMASMSVDMNMKMLMTADMEVMGDSAGLKKLKFTYTKADMSMDMKGLPTGTPGNLDEIMKSASKHMEGKSIVMCLNKNNEIADVQGMEALADSTYTDNPAAAEQFKKMFSKEQLNSMMGVMFQMYPDHPVRVGDSWEKETEVSINNIKMKMKNKFRLKDVSNGVANVEIDTKYSGNGKMEQGSISADMEMNGIQKGYIGINMDNGYLKGADYTIDIDAKANLMGQSIPYIIKGNYIMKGH